MELRDLDYFLACCRTGSFTTAAREVHIVQSAMSSAIARLEKDLGVVLFDRTVTPVVPTEHGAALEVEARRILEAVQAARDRLAAVSGQVRGTVVFGSTLHTGPLDLAVVLAAVQRRHPDVVVHLRQSSMGSAGNLQALRDGSMDVALVAVPSVGEPPPGVDLRPLVAEPLVFVCRADHPLAARVRLAVPQLAGERILRFPPGWGVRDTVDQVLGMTPSAVEVADYELMANLVRSGFGTTLMPVSAVAARRGLARVPVEDPRLLWSLSAATSANRRPTAAAAALLEGLGRAGPPR